MIIQAESVHYSHEHLSSVATVKGKLDGRPVYVSVEARYAADVAEALDRGEEVEINAESWQVWPA